MTAKEYLSQAYRLDQRINSNIEEVTMLREMASSIYFKIRVNMSDTKGGTQWKRLS